MLSADEEVVLAASQWLEQGHPVVLATVTGTWGSSPRPVGSLMAMRADGQLVGSVSGGCIEDDLMLRLHSGELLRSLPQVLVYGPTTPGRRDYGLPCNGRLEVVLERLDSAAPWRELSRALAARQTMVRRLCLGTGEASLHPDARPAVFQFDGANLYKPFGPTWRLLLIGAGQVSRFLADMARALDYEVRVCDPRVEYSTSWNLTGVAIDNRMPDDVVRDWAGDNHSAVVALTHDPRLDDLALLEALTARTFYVGALGSQDNSRRRRVRLATLGLSAAQIARLHGPVGLDIGSRTPGEIAVSILAQLTALRNAERATLRRDEKACTVAASCGK
jgi:xanthine dehydrogenase accessory factor